MEIMSIGIAMAIKFSIPSLIASEGIIINMKGYIQFCTLVALKLLLRRVCKTNYYNTASESFHFTILMHGPV